jgi:hypothetical protein
MTNEPIHYAAPGNQHTLRIVLRLWGVDEPVVKSWISELPTCNGVLSWEVSNSCVADGAHIVVNMVKPSRHASGAFCWNCVGANRAMLRSWDMSRTEMVLFVGAADQLPSERVGHWSIAGRLTPYAALHNLALLIDASCERIPQGHATVRRDLLALIAGHVDAAYS